MRVLTRVHAPATEAVIAPSKRAARGLLGDYLSLAKPRIILLLLVTTLCAMLVADAGWPGTALVVATLVGTALAAAGANAINCYFDADIDAIMARTRGRPVPARRLSRPEALMFGLVVGAVAFVLLATLVNLLTAVIAFGALAFYVFVYTAWLKRLTPQNIVIGGAAGAVPPLIGWAAATGGLDPAALALFAIIFYWTPPHFWALALIMSDDYRLAGVPMLPNVVGAVETRRQMLLYALLLLAISLILVPIADMGAIYLASALALGGLFVGMTAYLLWRPSRILNLRLWRYSVFYLGLLFIAMVIDRLAS